MKTLFLLDIKKGLRTDIARRFSGDCRKPGNKICGTFIPGETHETIETTIVRELLVSREMTSRRLREGVEFFRFLRKHEA
jgi:hypothetical protein